MRCYMFSTLPFLLHIKPVCAKQPIQYHSNVMDRRFGVNIIIEYGNNSSNITKKETFYIGCKNFQYLCMYYNISIVADTVISLKTFYFPLHNRSVLEFVS